MALATVFKPTGPGTYLTRSGQVAIIDRLTWDSKWKGTIPGLYTNTWWKLDGRHNLFPSDDIIGYSI